jgi:UDP-N-acetylglucosamine--N-acetylmuramyl-(pentapeptide) pyrophosphoryl-undecaprenol N-acetylglucosamine transferase
MTTLLVTSVGGHLTQMHRLLPRLQGIDSDYRWVTFDGPQSRSLLDGHDVTYLDYTGPRDVKNILRHSLVARRLFGDHHNFSSVISTGSGIALSFLPLARLRGIPCHYIESFTRSTGPSLTGALLARVPGIRLYAQYPGWAERPWRYAGSVFDTYVPNEPMLRTGTLRRVVVTLGTMEDYSFRRLVERVVGLLDRDVEVLWQVGCTDVAGLGIEGRRQLPARELQEAIRDADVVIAHAGCGSSLSALEAGKQPVLVPRLAAHGENVDDHQALLAEELSRRGLAIVRSVETLSIDDLHMAARTSVRTLPQASPFQLAC